MRKRILIPLMIILVLVVTFSSSVAFFSLLENGTTENTVVVMDGMKFIYKELDNNGNGINLNDAYPISDNEGKSLDTYFDFRIESRLKDDSVTYNVIINTTQSTIPDNNIKVYLTEVNGNQETEINNVINKLSEYEQSEKGRIIYSETINKDLVSNYTKNFRLRLWLSDDISDYDELVGTTGIYTVDVNSDAGIKPTSPIIAGGETSTEWVNNAPVVRLASNNNAHSSSGISHYEVYDSNTTALPTDETEATTTTQDEYQVITKGTHYVYYRAVSNDGLKSEWSEPQVVSLETRLKPSYGSSIPSSIGNLYYTFDGEESGIYSTNNSYCQKVNGNYSCPYGLALADQNRVDMYSNYGTPGSGQVVFAAATHSPNLSQPVSNAWVGLSFDGGYTANNPKTLSGIKLNFSNGQSLTIQQAVTNGYIEPLVVYGSGTGSSTNYYWTNMSNTLTGGSTSSSSYPQAKYILKVKNVSPLKSITFVLNTAWYAGNGVAVYKYNPNFDLSISPFVTQYRYTISEAFKSKILKNNIVINTDLSNNIPNLTTTSQAANDSGFYELNYTDNTETKTTYFYRGNINNNYVSFAGQTWRIVRINEDGTIRLVLNSGINNNTAYTFNSTSSINNAYFSNSDVTNGAMRVLNNWYNSNLSSYANSIATGNYYCEAAKVTFSQGTLEFGNATFTYYADYTPTFKCISDGNTKGSINTNIGLLTYDEVLFAGAHRVGYSGENKYYLEDNIGNTYYYWTLTPGQIVNGNMTNTVVSYNQSFSSGLITSAYPLRPVINLKSTVRVIGAGTASNPYIVVE